MKTAFVNGQLYTPEAIREKMPPAEAVLVEAGKVVAVGTSADLRRALSSEDTTVDLQGNRLYPGFHDAHTHLGSYGTRLRQLDLHGLPNLKAVLERTAAYARTLKPGEWLVGRGWDESRWPENRYITRADLDPITPNNPALLLRVDGHMGVFNSLGLRTLGQSTSDLSGLSDVSDGILRESALDSAREKIQPTVAQRKQDILAAIQKAHELGVTAIGEIATREDLHAFLDLWRAGELKLRVNLIPIWEIWDDVESAGLKAGAGDDILCVHGIKFFADGSIGARTALLSEDYADAPGNRGQPYLDLPMIEEAIRTVVAAGFQPVTHAIGDAAIERVLSIYERLSPLPTLGSRVSGLRPRIEHLEMPTLAHLDRLKALGGIASMQPNFIGEWGLPGAMYEQRLGLARREAMNPLWEIQHRGLPLCFGSDMMPFSPLYGIRCALMAPARKQQLKERDAVLAYTEGAAYAAFRENLWGKTAPGFCADFAALSDSPSEMANVLMTVFNGEIVFRRGL